MKNKKSETEAGAWRKMQKGKRYALFAAKEASMHIEQEIKKDLFDGILLCLSSRNEGASMARKRRVLRRIVERKQAQATFRFVGRGDGLLAASVVNRCSSMCMDRLDRYRRCM